MLKKILTCTLFLLTSGYSIGSGSVFENQDESKAPPRTCEIRQDAWCIYSSNITIENQPSLIAGYRTSWRFWGGHWAEFPAVILEPKGCRSGLSDTVDLIKYQPNFQWNGRKWLSMDVRLKKDGSCDLKLLSPGPKEDPVGAARSALLTLIRVCQTSACEGPVLAEKVSVPARVK